MSEQVRIKISPDSKMVEIDISKQKHYKNRVELGLMLNTHTLAKSEYDSELLAEEVVHRLVGILQEHMANEDAPYGVEITNWSVAVHDTKIAKEDE